MSMQDLLCKNYHKNPLPEMIRFSIVIANIIIFFRFSGCIQNNMFGPQINKSNGFKPIRADKEHQLDSNRYDPLIYFSVLDLIALSLGMSLSMKQLSFGRPEIDSFNEILYMPAQEKKLAIWVFVFCFFKLCYQHFFFLDADTYSDSEFRRWTMMRKYTPPEEPIPVFVSNLLLLMSSGACVWSSYTFKYEMRNAERAMTIQLFSILFKVVIVAFALNFTFIIFIAENKCLAIIYLLVLMYDIVRIVILLLYSEKKRQIRVGDYLKSLKWISFVLLNMVVFGQVIFHWLRLMAVNNDTTREQKQSTLSKILSKKPGEGSMVFDYFDYFFLYFEPADQHWRLKNVIGIYFFMIEAVILDFLNKIQVGASLDVFELNVWSQLEKNLISKNKPAQVENLQVTEDSYMSTYFVDKFFNILEIKMKDVFTMTYEYSSTIILQLKAESLIINEKFERLKTAYSAILQKKQKFFARAFQFLKWLRQTLVLHIFLRLELYIRLLLYILSAFKYLFYVKKPMISSWFIYFLLVWTIISMVCKSPRHMMWVTIVLIYPSYVFDFVRVVFMRLSLDSRTRKEIMVPLNLMTSLVILSLASFYLLLTIVLQAEDRNNFYHRFLDSMIKKNEASTKRFKSVTKKVMNVVFLRMKFIFRYIPLLLAIYTALHSISFLNLILLILALIFMWDSSLDKKYWGYFNCYTIFLIVIKQLCNYQLTLHDYNIESLAIIGFVSIEAHTNDSYALRSLMIFNFLLIFFSCFWYKQLHLTQESEEDLQKEDQRRLRDFEDIRLVKKFKAVYTFFNILLKYYSIWFFHICANFLLLTDIRDVISLPVIIFELVSAIIHVAIWNRKGAHPYLKIYYTWLPIFFLVIFYALSRYLFFFFKYTSIRGWFSGLGESVDGIPDSGQDAQGGQSISEVDHYIVRSIHGLAEEDLHTQSTFVALYIRPLLMLSLAVFTREKFLNILALAESKEKEEDKKTKNKSSKTKQSKIAFKEDEESKLALNAENDDDENDEEKKGAQFQEDGSDSNSDSQKEGGLSNQKEAPNLEEEALEEDVNKELGVGLDEGANTKDYEEKKQRIQEKFHSDLSRQSTNTSMFVVTYLIYKGLFLGLVMNFFHHNMNLFKLVMLLFYLLNMWTVFKKLAQIAEELRLVELFTLRIKYFYLTFLFGKKWDDECEIEKKINEKYDEEVQARDFGQNKIYYTQFMLRMESVVFLVNRVFWALTFFPLIVLSGLIFLLALFGRSPEFISTYHLDILTGISSKKWGDEEAINSEILGLQIITIGLLMEYMLTSYYLDLKTETKMLDPLEMDNVLLNIIAKYLFLIEVRVNKTRKLNEEKFSKFFNSLCDVPFAVYRLKSHKHGLDSPSGARDFFNKTSSSDPTKKIGQRALNEENLDQQVAESMSQRSMAQAQEIDQDPGKEALLKPKNAKYLFSSNEYIEDSDMSEDLKKMGSRKHKGSQSKSSVDEEKTGFKKNTIMEFQEDLMPKNSELNLETLDYTKDILQSMLKRISDEGDEKSETSIYVMSEAISKEEMLLFLHRNKYKYYLCKSMEGLLYAVTRMSLLTLIIPFSREVNLLTLGFYIFFIAHSFKSKRIFLEDVIQKNTVILVFLMLQLTHDFFHAWLMSNMDPLKKTAYQSFMTAKPMVYSYSYLLRPISGDNYSVAFYWVFLNSFAFALVPIFIWFSTKALFREKILKKDIFHCHIYDKNGERNIVIDYNKWKNSGLKILNFLYKQTYLDSVDLHSTIIFFLLVAFWKDLYALLFIYTLGVMAYENFRSDIQEESGAAKSGFRTRIIYHVMRAYMIIYWFILILFHVMNLLGHLGFFKDFYDDTEKYMAKYSGGNLVVFLIMITGIFLDLIESEDFSELYTKLKMESDLKIRFSNLCRAYDINENKIYGRTVEIMRKKVIDDISKDLLDNKNLENMKINTKYSEKCFIKNLNDDSELMTEKHLGMFPRLMMKTINNFYRFLTNNSDKYRNLDIFFLYHLVQSRNKILLLDSSIELAEYLAQDFSFFSSRFKNLDRFYTNLVAGDEESNMKYKAKCEQFYKNNFDKLLLRPQIGKVNRTRIRDNIQASKPSHILMEMASTGRLRGRKSKNLSYLNFANNLSPISPGSGNSHQGRRSRPSHHKDPVLLSEAAGILADYISTDNMSESQLHFDSYKMFLQRYGSLNCTFGAIKVILYNINRDHVSETLGFNIVKWKIMLKYLFLVLNTKAERIAALILIGISITNGGFFNFVTIGILIFTIFIEESSGRSFWWKIVYVCFLISTVMKQIYDQLTFTKNHPQIIYFLFGTNNRTLDVALFLIPIHIIGVLKKYAVDNQCAIDFENPGLAVTRLTINEDFPNMVDRCCHTEIKIKEQTNIYLGSRRQIALTDIELQEFKMLTIKQVIKHYSMLEKFRKEFLSSCQKLVKTTKFDCMRVSSSDINKFFYRNFSQYMRKKGVSYNGVTSVLLMIMIIYILTFFPTMEAEGGKILGFLTENKVTAFTALNFAIYLTFFIVNYLIGQMKSEDNRGLTSKSYSASLISNYDYPAPIVTDLTPIQKFRRRVNYVKNALTLKRMIALHASNEANKVNPLVYLFMFALVVWTYVNLSVFFWHPYHSNPLRSSKKGLYKFVCEENNPKDNDYEGFGSSGCKNFLQNPLSQIFYFLNIVYLTICMKQIEAGKLLQITKITHFERILELVKYKAYKVLPLVRPTQITFEYCATKTALWFKDFFLLRELEFLLQDAKIFHQKRMKKKAGTTINHRFQNLICWGVLVGVVLIFAIPLFLFYDSTNKNYYDIKASALKIQLDADDQKITDLYMTKTMINNKVMSQSTEEDRIILDEKILQTDSLKRYDRDQFIVTEFSKSSDQFANLIPRVVQDLNSFLRTSKDNLNIKTTFQFETEAKDPISSKTFVTPITSSMKSQMISMLASGCQREKYVKPIETELFLFVKPQVVLLDKEKIEFIESKIDNTIRIALAMKCSPETKNYVVITDDRPTLRFYVIAKPKIDIGFFMDKISLKQLNLRQIYLILFVGVGYNLIRKTIFGKTPFIWNTNIPDPDRLLVILDAIEYARFERDLVKEELLFFILMDILRNPELLRSMTTSVYDKREESLYRAN